MATTRKPLVLTELPLELLWMISGHLSPADSACLALCNHYLLRCFEGTFSKNFSNGRSSTPSPTDDARIELLTRLSYNLPQYYLCNICLRLHLWRNVGLPNSSSPGFSHSPADLDIHPDPHLRFGSYHPAYMPSSHYKFHFVHLQLAMRRFYHGPEFGIPVESLLYTEVAAMRLPFRPTGRVLSPPLKRVKEGFSRKNIKMMLFSAEARICSTPPGLCMRTQDVALVTRENMLYMWTRGTYEEIYVCKHIHSKTLGFGDVVGSQFGRDFEGIIHVVNKGSCDHCNTSWQLELRLEGWDYASMILTRWMDLGPGLSVDDVDWKYRLREETSTPPEGGILDSRQRFEKDALQGMVSRALSEEGMYLRNIALIRGKGYQRVMAYKGDGVYVLHGESKARPLSSRCIIV
ncbi:hypothetical protein N7541_010567 [Penicillium brevicompactum]|uniref:F-box domain-containing protein n=1 Tax=Penicillium brevicompactum TaxID=5074 RepID=A0A9W9QNY3_PENBR|nr:hypothetical protein N7541_010567 [Penicillium brevicompactum]